MTSQAPLRTHIKIAQDILFGVPAGIGTATEEGQDAAEHLSGPFDLEREQRQFSGALDMEANTTPVFQGMSSVGFRAFFNGLCAQLCWGKDADRAVGGVMALGRLFSARHDGRGFGRRIVVAAHVLPAAT